MKDENPFKQKLYHHTVAVPDELWGRIETQLPDKIDKKKFPFFWMALTSIIVMAGVVLFLAFEKTTPPEEKIRKEDQLEQPQAPTALEPTDVSYKSETSATSANDDVNNSSSNNSIADRSSAISNNSMHAAENKELSLNNTTSEYHSRNSTPTDKSSGTTSEKLKSKTTNRSHDAKSNSTNYNSKLTGTDYSNANSSNNINQNLSITTSTLSNQSAQRSSFDIPGLESLPVEELYTSAELSATGIESIKHDPSCYKFSGKEKKSNLSADLYGGHGFSPRSFQGNGSESLLYAEARDITERNQYSWSAGIRVNLKLNRDFVARAGIMYDQTGDIFDYTDTLATQRTTRIDSFFAADGTFLYAESNSVLTFGTLLKKIHNRYHHVDIPLLASYEMPLGRRAMLMLNAGPVLNLTSYYRGQILDPGLIPQHITPREANSLKAYKNNLGLSLYLGAGILLPFSERFSGLIEPRFLYRLNPVTVDAYPLKERRHYAGLNIGIRYHLH